MQSLTYQPLLQGGVIRILKISPAKNKSDEVAATFHVQSLVDPFAPRFEALSYMWGDQTRRANIHVDGNPFSVSKHLHGTIQALRSATEPRLLWIDAICINQDDIQERNQQVQLMRTIYQRAKAVLVWLDRDVDPSHAAFQRLQTLTENSELSDLGDNPDLWDPLCEVFKDPYWSRVWIQQEISNAAALRLFCREVELSAFSVFHLLRLFSQVVLENILGQTWQDWALKKPSVILPPRFGLLNSQKEPIKGTTLGTEDLDITETLSKACTLKCTDDRDRVYGIMFLADDCKEGDIRVDYSFTVPEVYTEVVRCLITKYRSARFLLYSTLGHSTTSSQTKPPSWIPDWRRPPTRTGMPRSLLPLQQPRSPPQPTPFPQISNATLSLLAIKIDTIRTPYHHLFTTDVLSQNLSQFIQTLVLITTDAILLQAPPTDEPLGPVPSTPQLQTTPQWLALMRTLGGHDDRDLIKNPDLATVLYRGAEELLDLSKQSASSAGFDPDKVKLWRISNLPWDTQVLKLAKVFLSFAWWVLTRRRVPFLSAAGRIGMVPDCGVAGDELWLVPGCEGVVVLRPRDGGKRGVVGEGYLDGANFWEVVGGWKGVDEVTEGEELGQGKVEVLELI